MKLVENRKFVVIKPKKVFAEWVNSFDDSKIAEKEILSNSTVYMVEDNDKSACSEVIKMLMNQKKKLSISDLKILDQHIITNFDQRKTEEKELEINKDIYWVEGYLCALTSSPEPMIKMDFWLPYINGEDCVFESEEHANTIMSLIFSLRNNIADKLNDKSYKPLYETHNLKNEPKEILITKWAKGYLFATLLFHADLLEQDEEIGKLLVPIIMATTSS